MEKAPSQRQIKIDFGIWQELDKWLNSDEGKSQGYHSKAQFCTEAVNRLLIDKKTTNMKNITVIDHDTIKLIDIHIPIEKDPRITITLDNEFEWLCDYCKTKDCEHIQAIQISKPGFELQHKKTKHLKFLEEMRKEHEEEAMFEAGIDSSITE